MDALSSTKTTFTHDGLTVQMKGLFYEQVGRMMYVPNPYEQRTYHVRIHRRIPRLDKHHEAQIPLLVALPA